MNLYLKAKIYYLKKSFLYLKNYKKLGLLVIIFSLLSSLFDGFSIGAIIPFFQNLVSDSATPLFPAFENIQKYFLRDAKADIMIKLLVFALVMVILRSIFNYLKIITIGKTGNLIKKDLENNIFNAVSDSSLKFFHSMKSGEIIANTSAFTSSIIAFIFVLLNLVSNISKIIVYLGLLLLISWPLTFITVILFLLLFPFLKHFLKKIKQTSQALTIEYSHLYSHMTEMLSSIPLMKISGTEVEEKSRFNKITTNMALLEYNQSKQTSIIPLITESFVMAFIIIAIIFSSKVLKLDILLYLPFIIAYLYIFLRLFNEANFFLRSVSGMFTHAPAFKSYENELNKAKNMKLKEGEKKFTTLKNGITFNNVYFSYEENHPILNNINLKIKKGDFVALIGETGSGKTTIANLLAGLFLPDSGLILIDDQDLKTFNLKTWRQKIGFISQDIIIFNDSILNNLLYGAPAKTTIKDTVNASKIANINKFINTLPEKYGAVLGERGVKLSGGQKQRIALARAILRNPEILILDEATSSLDSKTEKIIQNSLEKILPGKTVIAIAHRLSTIMKADNIIVLEKGRVVEQGSHQELLTQNGIYKKYYDLQF